MIKKAARQLLEGEHNFTKEFSYNQKLLYNTMPSKPIKNKVAGYIARLVKMKEKQKTSGVKTQPVQLFLMLL